MITIYSQGGVHGSDETQFISLHDYSFKCSCFEKEIKELKEERDCASTYKQVQDHLVGMLCAQTIPEKEFRREIFLAKEITDVCASRGWECGAETIYQFDTIHDWRISTPKGQYTSDNASTQEAYEFVGHTSF